MLAFSSLVLVLSLEQSQAIFPPERRLEGRALARQMFFHGYNSYIENAFPEDELRPISCEGTSSYGGYSLTMIDTLDSLVVYDNVDEFINKVSWVSENISFDIDRNVSVFETNIRILGGLLSSHLLAEDLILDYDGSLLDMASDLGERLLVAFRTETGIPYGTVNLRHGVPKGETPVVCTACAGSFAVEFGLLSRLTGDPRFENASKVSALALFNRRSRLNLVGSHINSESGKWTDGTATIGSFVDSYFEYCVKAWILLGDQDYRDMFVELYGGIVTRLHNPLSQRNQIGWFGHVNMFSGKGAGENTNLASFFPGLLVLWGDIFVGQLFLDKLLSIVRRFDFIPERYTFHEGFPKILSERSSGNPLRPELVESIYYMLAVATGEREKQELLKVAFDMLVAFNNSCWTECGYAAILNVENRTLDDRMDSFWLSETLKYFYLIFDEDNTVNKKNVLFSTEAHFVDLRTVRKKELYTTAAQQAILPGSNDREWKPTWTVFEESALQAKLQQEKINSTASKEYQKFFQENILLRRSLFEAGGFPNVAQMNRARRQRTKSKNLACQTSYYHTHSPNFKYRFFR